MTYIGVFISRANIYEGVYGKHWEIKTFNYKSSIVDLWQSYKHALIISYLKFV